MKNVSLLLFDYRTANKYLARQPENHPQSQHMNEQGMNSDTCPFSMHAIHAIALQHVG